ncbi:hypothetical protein A9Z42_0060120 [Trichoderma parareesei]|uniref:BZIP domain-containing protein n=1 Tax=Trichoderma parareesei TaxID=858221 RepID=A0A2H2ZZR3_TRIPA|nr:hypothetical protein A9Z42_0060120 [Trichoderma parareesei]
MDFAAQYTFGPHQAFPGAFMPLTPSHSQSAGSDDFSNTSPPDHFADPFHAFDYAQAAFGGHHHPPPFAQHPSPVHQQHQHQDQLQHHHQQQLQEQHQQPHSPSTNGSVNGSVNGSNSIMRGENGSGSGTKAEGTGEEVRGSDDDDNMTPAQSRRKAQNRAAQRAFRERKERHVKDLESKLASLEAAQKEAASENERLRRDLQRMSTENEILRATSAVNQNQTGSHSPEPMTTGPMTYTPTDFYTNVLQGHNNRGPPHRIVTSDDGHRLLAAGAAWDYLLEHSLYKRGLVDVSKVAEYLRQVAKCDGQGPVFSERDINYAIEQSVASGSDDLL